MRGLSRHRPCMSSSCRMRAFLCSRASAFAFATAPTDCFVVRLYSHWVYPIVSTANPTMPDTSQADGLTFDVRSRNNSGFIKRKRLLLRVAANAFGSINLPTNSEVRDCDTEGPAGSDGTPLEEAAEVAGVDPPLAGCALILVDCWRCVKTERHRDISRCTSKRRQNVPNTRVECGFRPADRWMILLSLSCPPARPQQIGTAVVAILTHPPPFQISRQSMRVAPTRAYSLGGSGSGRLGDPTVLHEI